MGSDGIPSKPLAEASTLNITSLPPIQTRLITCAPSQLLLPGERQPFSCPLPAFLTLEQLLLLAVSRPATSRLACSLSPISPRPATSIPGSIVLLYSLELQSLPPTPLLVSIVCTLILLSCLRRLLPALRRQVSAGCRVPCPPSAWHPLLPRTVVSGR